MRGPGGQQSPGPPASAGRPREPRAAGDSAWSRWPSTPSRAGPTPSPRSRAFATTATRPPAGRRASSEAETARARGSAGARRRERAGLGAAAGRPTSRSRATRRSSGSSGPCCSTCSAAPTRARRSAFRRWVSPAPGTTATSSGTRTPGCSRRSLVTHPDVAHSLVAFRAPHAGRGPGQRQRQRLPRRDVSLGGRRARPRRPRPTSRCRTRSSEIHVNGDVALAQWQYYLATGDSAWLAREGYPGHPGDRRLLGQPRHAATRPRDRYHIDNVVSVPEGLIGVSDDAYTNAVARKNLEIAAAASAPARRRARSPLGRGGRRSCTCRTTRPASSSAPTRARPTRRSAPSRRSSAIPSGSR